MRWAHPHEGLLLPEAFIPMAEPTHLITRVTATVLAQAIEQSALWRAEGIALDITVNVSARDLLDPGFPDLVPALLTEYDVPAGSLQLDVTERAVLDDPDEAGTTLHLLGALGVRVSLDDFGSGRSSLGRLRDLPFDQLKIDRSFIAGIQAETATCRSPARRSTSATASTWASSPRPRVPGRLASARSARLRRRAGLRALPPAARRRARGLDLQPRPPQRGDASAAGDRSGRAGRAGRSRLAARKYGYPPRPAGLSLLRAPPRPGNFGSCRHRNGRWPASWTATSSRRCCTSRPRWASPTPWPSARRPAPSWRGSSGPSPARCTACCAASRRRTWSPRPTTGASGAHARR